MKKLTTKIIALVFVSISIVACKDEKKEVVKAAKNHQTEMKHDTHEHDVNAGDHHNDTNTTDRNIASNQQKNSATTPIINAYLAIKNGLVADDKAATAKGAKNLLAAFSKFDMSKLSSDTHKEYMEILESAKEQAEHIVKSPIDHQREHFETLSTDISDMITLLGTEKTLYQDYCPMAKASWLSEVKDIKNPYYGAKMMTCGSVKKQIN